MHARTVVSTTSAPLHGLSVEQGIECKPELIMLQNLPIILSRLISQIIHLLFSKIIPTFQKTSV